MKILTTMLVGLLLAGCAHAPVRMPQAAPARTQWEAEIQKFELADRAQPPAPGSVEFVGSSSIRMWESLAADFPGAPVFNRGFGGSELGDVLQYADRIIIPYRPRLVMVYAGDNDLAAGKTPEQVFSAYRALVQRIHQELPQTRIGFISIKPSPSRWQLVSQMRSTNAMVQQLVARDPRLFYVDVFTPMLGPDGKPREELFLADKLHMTPAGYAIWKAAIAPQL